MAGCERLIRQAVAELDRWGVRGERITLRSDGEPAIIKVRDAIAGMRMGPTHVEKSARGESEGNGMAEAAGKNVMGDREDAEGPDRALLWD